MGVPLYPISQTAGAYKIPKADGTGKIAAGFIPDLSAAIIAAGQLALARGGTNADLSATGGSNQFVKQSSAGAALTVGAILSADLTSALTTPPPIGGGTPSTGAFTAIVGNALTLNGASGAGYAEIPNQASAPSTPTSALRLYADVSNRLAWRHATGFAAIIDTSGFTADRVITFPNATGTLVTQAATQTLTNKTLTSPTLNTPVVSGGTIDGTVIGATTRAAGSFTTLTAWHPAPTGTAGGITLKRYNPNEGGYASMELAGTGPGWTLGKGIIFDNYAANIKAGSTFTAPAIAANIAWLGSSSYGAADPALTVVANSGRVDIQALLYASGPYPALAISAPELRINTKAAAAWSDGGSGFTGYGTERLRVNDAGLRVEAASALNFGDETADNAWRDRAQRQ
ncbi:MAG: hypothetical protein IPK17_38440 [Chloroflexi bacterium]|uniref:hypothetical protein n=1 Tax=Candidatus Flexifilum breve TaxID=3140694 RepID=UPI00313516BE|nr:hypothetical protein [Chloroflexota bacterium]